MIFGDCFSYLHLPTVSKMASSGKGDEDPEVFNSTKASINDSRRPRGASKSASSATSATAVTRSGRSTRQPSKLTSNGDLDHDPAETVSSASGKNTSDNKSSKHKNSSAASKASRSDDHDVDCSKCNGTINESTKALRCEFCSSWTCLHCTNIPGPLYDLMLTKEIPNFLWTCDSCIHALPTITKLGKTLQSVRDDQTQCKEDIIKLTEKVDDLEVTIDDKVQDALDNYKDHEARKCNIIIHNLP